MGFEIHLAAEVKRAELGFGEVLKALTNATDDLGELLQPADDEACEWVPLMRTVSASAPSATSQNHWLLSLRTAILVGSKAPSATVLPQYIS
jgi:hypothetical protein